MLGFSLSSEMKNVIKISSGTLVGNMIGFFSLLIIARIYGAEIMGTMTLLNSIAVIINSFSDLGLTNAIMIEEEKYVKQLYTVITTVTLIICIGAGIVIGIGLKVFQGNADLNYIAMGGLIMILAFTMQQTQICYTWLNRKGAYGVLMKNPVINNLVIAVVAITLGIFGLKQYGYYLAVLLGQIVTILHMKCHLPKEMFNLKKEDYREAFSGHKHFLQYQMPTNIISQVKNQLPNILIKTFFGTKMLGYYSISVKMINMPVTLLGNAIGRVFFKTTSEMMRKGEKIGLYVYKNITRAMKIAFIPMVCLLAFGDIVIILMFGKEYYIAGLMLRIVALQNYFIFLMMSSAGLSITLNKQSYAMISGIAQMGGYVLGMGAGKYIFHNIYIALFITSVIFVIIQLVYFCFLFHGMEISWRKYLFKSIVGIVAIMLSGWLLRKFGLLLLGKFGMNLKVDIK